MQLTLTRGTKVLARASVQLDADGTADYRLKLPKGIKAGRYTLKATFGVGDRVAHAHAHRQGDGQARAPARCPRSKSAPARAPCPDGRFHGARPQRTFKVR